MIIALTGGIACGKSTLGDEWKKQGWQVLDTDLVAHHLMEPGRGLVESIVALFGREVLDPEGQIDRKVLGGIVFTDELKREALNALVHPAVKKYVDEWKQALSEDQDAVVIVPLLFESGWEKEAWQAIVCVTAPAEFCLRRIMLRGFSHEEAVQRIEAQWPIEKKVKRSNFVIKNDGDLKNLYEQVKQIIHALRRME